MDIAKARQIATDVLGSYVEARHISDHHIAGAQLAVSIAILDELRKLTDPVPNLTDEQFRAMLNPGSVAKFESAFGVKLTEGEPDGPDCG